MTHLQFGGGSNVMSANSFWILQNQIRVSEMRYCKSTKRNDDNQKQSHSAKITTNRRLEQSNFPPGQLIFVWALLLHPASLHSPLSTGGQMFGGFAHAGFTVPFLWGVHLLLLLLMGRRGRRGRACAGTGIFIRHTEPGKWTLNLKWYFIIKRRYSSCCRTLTH